MNRIANWIFNSIKWPEKLDFDSWGWAHRLLFRNGYNPEAILSSREIFIADSLNPLMGDVMRHFGHSAATTLDALIMTSGEL